MLSEHSFAALSQYACKILCNPQDFRRRKASAVSNGLLAAPLADCNPMTENQKIYFLNKSLASELQSLKFAATEFRQPKFFEYCHFKKFKSFAFSQNCQSDW